MLPTPLRVLCALMLGGLAAHAQETKTLHTFDRLPFAPAGAPIVTYGNNNWAPVPDTDATTTPKPNRITYEGLELGDNANTNGAFTLTFSTPLDLSRYERIDLTAAALPGNALNRLNLELTSGSGTGVRRTVHYAFTDPLTRHGDKLGFPFNAPNRWHRDSSPVDYSAVTSIRVSGDWVPDPKAARLIIRDLTAVNRTLFDPVYFPADRILSYGQSWSASRVPQNNQIVIEAFARETNGTYGSLYLRYANDVVKDERDLTPYSSFTVTAATLPGNEADLRLELRSIGGGVRAWTLPRGSFAGGATVAFDLRTPDDQLINLSRISGISVSAIGNSSTTDVRWSLGAIDLEPATPAVFTYRRGMSIGHWMSQLNAEHPIYANPARFNPTLVSDIATWLRGSGATAQRAFDHIRIPVEYDHWGTLGGTATAPTFTFEEDPISHIPRFEEVLAKARAEGLGVILDLHKLPGLALNSTHTLFNDPTQQLQAQAVWRAVATRFASEGPWLRFELMNEPVNRTAYGFSAAEAKEVADVQEGLRRAVRETNPNRVIYITTNDAGSRSTFYGARYSQPGYPQWKTRPATPVANPDYGWDKNIAYTLHYYEPLGLTHFASGDTPWTDTAITAAFGEDGTMQSNFNGLRDDALTRANDNHYLLEYREIHIGEFGIYQEAARRHGDLYYVGSAFHNQGYSSVREHFMKRVRILAEERGFAWSAWDYINDEFSLFNMKVGEPVIPNSAGRALLNP